MSYAKSLPLLIPQPRGRMKYVIDSVLVLASVSLLTSIISFMHLSVKIADSLLIYLLVVLAFACIRGLYAALLASFLAFFVFDFFFIAPFHSLAASKFEDIIGLIVFLVTAVITGQLTSALRLHALQADRREHETYILYDFVRATNREHNMESQLQVFVNAVVKVFSAWGIRDCMLFLPDAQGVLKPLPSSMHLLNPSKLLPDEEMLAAWVMEKVRSVDLYAPSLPSHNAWNNGAQAEEQETPPWSPTHNFIRFVPLKGNREVVGVLCLLIERSSQAFTVDNRLEMENSSPTPQAAFFSTFLEQAVTVIEQGRLRKESMSLKAFQQTEELRTALLFSVSHDLRTPLSTIKTAASSLLQEEIQQDKEGLCSIATAIEHEADRLDFLVENVLDMSRIEAGILCPDKIWYPLDELIHDVVGRMRPLLQGREVQTQLPDNLPPVEIDYVQIDQVVSNLLENAAHHTADESPIDICIQVQKGLLLVSVADHGPGVPQNERERIFEKFYRLHEKTYVPGRHTGLGLGLAICRGIVEAHGGQIWMEPREGGGAAFYFTLPLREMD